MIKDGIVPQANSAVLFNYMKDDSFEALQPS